jgi:RNA polymerase sigma-70 factor (ECF subfamily)
MGAALAFEDIGPTVRAAQAGEGSAQRELLEHLARELLPFALALCREPREADEVLGDTLSRVYERLSQLKEPRALGAWARRIMVRRFLDGRAWWRTRGVDFESLATQTREPVDLEHLALRAAISRLPRKDQALLAMHYSLGMTLADCAEMLSVPEGTVKSRLWSIRSTLRKELEEL